MVPGRRIRRYSGRDRPAWRMNHTGTRAAGRLWQASRKGTSAGGGIGGHATAGTPMLPSPGGGTPPSTRAAPGLRMGAMRPTDEDTPDRGHSDSLADGVGEVSSSTDPFGDELSDDDFDDGFDDDDLDIDDTYGA